MKMKIPSMITRCKYKTGDERHKRIHISIDSDNTTLCGRKMSGMWYVEGYFVDVPKDHTICRICKKKFEETKL